MKFAHEFKDALIKEGFPPHWVESAVPYGQLKKVIKQVNSELVESGLYKALGELVANRPEPEGEVASAPRASEDNTVVQYDFCGETKFRPKLILSFENGLAVEAKLSPDTRRQLESWLSRQGGRPVEWQNHQKESSDESKTSTGQVSNPDDEGFQQVEIPLKFDAEFFELLQGDVTVLDALQAGEQKTMIEEITELSKEVTVLTKPAKFNKTDMYRWRELFDIYLQAGIFFSTNELDHGSRNSAVAAKKLEWFQSEVTKRGLVQAFKLPASRQALDRFVDINITLLRNLKFQEINQKAISKILKKFDKRTQLNATKTFPKLIQFDPIMSDTMAKAVCSQVTQDLVKITPQLDDYLCPICFTISWRPVRMKCQHIFCIRCTIVMQRERKKFCPICRGNVIMEADEDNIDGELASFLKKYFPKETRQKQIELETAAGKEQFGVYYKHPSESKCSVM